MKTGCFDSFNTASLAHTHYLCSVSIIYRSIMPNSCCVCGRMKGTDPGQVRTLHRFPADNKLRAKWLDSLHLKEEDISPHSRVCNLHFRDGNTKTIPSVSLGIRLCSPPSYSTPRGKRAANRTSLTDSD